MRITGTGVAYRSKLDEYVYRDPEIYINDEFLARCNGLPIILEHPPESEAISTDYYREMVAGAIFLPYIKGDEVWGIARIHDENIASAMLSGELSTSPFVSFSTTELDNQNIQIDSNTNILIEGKPSIIDHLAICSAGGVWDKGDKENKGININNEEVLKMENEENAPVATDSELSGGSEIKKDISIDERILAKLDSIEKRLEAVEKPASSAADTAHDAMDLPGEPMPSVGDSSVDKEKEAKDKADSEKEEKEKEEKEKSYADSQISDLKAQIKALEEKIPRQRSNTEYDALAAAQGKFEKVYLAHGDSASKCRPMDGEGLTGYRKRMLTGLKAHSSACKNIDIAKISDAAMLDMVESTVYADSMAVATAPSTGGLPNGMPREIRTTDMFGHPNIEFKGGDFKTVFSPWIAEARQLTSRNAAAMPQNNIH
jgi:hypothetical protein